MVKTFYHTQESRDEILSKPLICYRDDAWLGTAAYFWYEEGDADKWGNSVKTKRGYFEVYKSSIECEDVLDTVFNEDQYYFWLRTLEKVANTFMKKTRQKPTLKEMNDYFKERATWESMAGILFQDLPTNNDHLLIKPIHSSKGKIRAFAYKKRIQLAVFNLEIVRTFALLKKEQCVY